MRCAAAVGLTLTGLLAQGSLCAQETRHDWALEISLDALSSDAHSSDAGNKLAAASEDASGRLAFLYTGDITPTLQIDAAIDAVNDGTAGIDVTEAFVHWRPVPRSRVRHEVRTGIFYPPLSLENNLRGWASPYSTSFSAINTWVGEELRTIGAEWRVTPWHRTATTTAGDRIRCSDLLCQRSGRCPAVLARLGCARTADASG